MNNTITITQERYDQLLAAERYLAALYAGGVDNWEGYEEAMNILDDDSV